MTAQYNFIIDTGIISVDTQDLLTDVQNEYRTALGVNIDVDSSTPQGTLMEGEAVSRASLMKNNAELANVINPNYSYGTHLDSVAAFLGVTRKKDMSTSVQAGLISGDPATAIPAGSRIRTPDGEIFTLLANATIGSDRTVRANFISQKFGPIPCANPLEIVDGKIGWGGVSIDNTTIVTLGTLALTDAQLKNARNQELYKQGLSSTGAIYSRLLALPNVNSISMVENNTGAVGTINGVTFTTPSGLWVCVAGAATPASVAASLHSSRQAGCPYVYGDKGVQVNPPDGVIVTDPYSLQKYKVKYVTPNLFDIYINLTVRQGTSVASTTAIVNIIMDYANGRIEGETGFTVGASVSAFEIGAAVNDLSPGLYIKNCVVAAVATGTTPPVYPAGYSTEWVAAAWQQGILNQNNITVTFI